MNNLIESIEYKGYTIKIYADDFPPDPIEDFDWLGTMVCWHSRYNIGHKHKYNSSDEFITELAMIGDISLEDKIEYWESGNGWKSLTNENKAIHYESAIAYSDQRISNLISKAIDDYYIMLNIYMYDHSGITIKTSPFSCPWDSGQIGFIYVSKKKIKKEYGWKVLTKKRITQIENYLKNEVKTYDQYLRGEVYGYSIIDPVTNESIDLFRILW